MQKTIYISFFSPEIDIDLEGVSIGDITLEIAAKDSMIELLNFRCEGEPMKQWVIDANIDEITELLLQEVDCKSLPDGAHFKVGGNKYESHFVFRGTPSSYKAFAFDTAAELDAFEAGVDAAIGWLEYLRPEEMGEHDLQTLEQESPMDYKALCRHLRGGAK